MGRLTVLLILLIVCEGVVFDPHALASQSGLDPDIVENLTVNSSFTIIASFTIFGTFLARWIHQIKLSQQIVFRFFFFSWRNYIYGHPHQILTT